MSRARLFRTPRGSAEDGVALAAVILVMFVVGALVLAGLGYAARTVVLARSGQDFDAALNAAQAGIADFLRRLNNNDTYWLQSSIDQPGYADCTGNTALMGPGWPKSSNCYSSTIGWQAVNAPGAQPDTNPYFHYEVYSQSLASSQYLVIVSTGKVHNVTRTLRAQLKRGGSTDFVYYTDFEDADPANQVVYPSGAPSNCVGVYWWNGRSTNDNGCVEITFITGDVLNGRVHTNDTPLMTGSPEFTGIPGYGYSLETSDPACKTAKASNYDYFGCWRDTRTQTPKFDLPPTYAPVLQLPDNSSQFVTTPGCKFVGQTRIRFTGTGNMLVWSPETTSSNSPTTAQCGGNSPAGVSVPVPNGQTIYVSNNPKVAPHQCAAGEIGDGLPVTNDVTMQTRDQYCGQGNVYIEGTLQGRVTVAAENSIVVTGDLLLANGPNGQDILGLVAGNNIEVMHPWVQQCTQFNRNGTCKNYTYTDSPSQTGGYPHKATSGKLQIYASIQTLQHSFWVQNYNQGSAQGTLYVYGSIAQRYRGIVGTTAGTGYIKSYNYDPRLVTQAPPYFPQWQNAVWSVTRLGEVPAEYGP